MSVPKVAIVGRPNVGKSSLFNWLDGRRLAIVDDVAGVTRDRMTTLIEHEGRFFELIDTGGMGIQDVDNLTSEVEQQIEMGINEADLLLFVVDTRQGVTTLDLMVADRLRKVDKPILLVANKADHDGLDIHADEFHKLGRGWLIRVSVLQNRNRDELFTEILSRLPEGNYEPPAESRMKIAIVGKRNVGKSTFVNTLAQAERVIVSEVPGTTRDSIDVHFELDSHRFTAIDTPGLRRNKSVRTDLDFYGTHRAQRSIRRADVVLLFFDSKQGISKVDKQLAQYIEENFKPCIFVVNKWDLLANEIPTERWVRYIRENFPTMAYAPIAFITGQTGKNIKALLNHAQMLFTQAQKKISTPQLNRLVSAVTKAHEPAMYQGKRPKIYYSMQIAVTPPTLVALCNNPDGFTPSYRRYFLTIMRDHLPFGEVPIKLFMQKRSQHQMGVGSAPSKGLDKDDKFGPVDEAGAEGQFDSEDDYDSDDEFESEEFDPADWLDEDDDSVDQVEGANDNDDSEPKADPAQ